MEATMTTLQPDHSLADAVCAAHVAAWRETRFSVARYCRQQRIACAVFVRWVMAIEAAESPVNAEELSPRARRRERGIRLPTTMKNQATQAFWAMHVEALNWSGMRLRAYANALHLSHYSLKKWRDRIAAGKVEGDWRRLLHPSARPPLSTGARPSAKPETPENRLTDTSGADLETAIRLTRRSFSHEEKLAVVLETERAGATVSGVAREHRLVPSTLFRWRVELGFSHSPARPARLVAVQLETATAGNAGKPILALDDLLPQPPGMKAIELADGRRVYAPADADPEAVRRRVEAAP
jgi:transposase-like protein